MQFSARWEMEEPRGSRVFGAGKFVSDPGVKSFGAWRSFPKILLDCTLRKACIERETLTCLTLQQFMTCQKIDRDV